MPATEAESVKSFSGHIETLPPIDSLSSIRSKANGLLFYNSFPYLRFSRTREEAHLVQISDDDFLDTAGKVVFKVNRFDTFTNDSLLHELEDVVIPRINNDSMQLLRIIVRGAASPEGPVANNRMLGRRRAQMLFNFLRARIKLPVEESDFTTESITEDYQLLMAMMRRAHDPAYETVKRLCDRHLPRHEYTLMKREMQNYNGGLLWHRLLKEYFPELRATRLILIFERKIERASAAMLQPTSEIFQLPDTLEPLPLSPLYEQGERLERRELLAVKSNLLFDFAYVPGYDRWCPIPNVALEFFPLHGHFTFGASIDFPWWQHYWDHKYFQMRNYQLEGRYYFRSGDIARNLPGKGAAFRGFYLQAYAHAGLYCFVFDADRGWVGEALGGGIGAGYVLPLGRRGHWRLEFGIQVGYLYSGYDPFQFEYRGNMKLQDHLYYYDWTLPASQFKERQYRFSWLGPTRVGITLSYDILYRRRAKRGISFRHSERAY